MGKISAGFKSDGEADGKEGERDKELAKAALSVAELGEAT